jgi:hypothetical protein
MKYFAEITQNNQPKNKAETAAKELAHLFDQTLAISDAAKNDAILHIRNEIKKINHEHRRCGDVNVSQWIDPIYNHINLVIGGCTTLTFKRVKEEFGLFKLKKS